MPTPVRFVDHASLRTGWAVPILLVTMLIAGCAAPQAEKRPVDFASKVARAQPATNADYGYRENAPIRLGGFFDAKGSTLDKPTESEPHAGRRIKLFLEGLLFNSGSPVVSWERHACCSFQSRNSFFNDGVGILDIYRVTAADGTHVDLYVDHYNEEVFFIPQGFRPKGAR